VKPVEIEDRTAQIAAKYMEALAAELPVQREIKPRLPRQENEILSTQQSLHRIVGCRREGFEPFGSHFALPALPE
jgi:hypothetical protein